MIRAIIVLIVLAAWRLPPDLDETYYWTWSRDLAWSYFDHPPAIAWAIRIFGLRPLSLLCMAIVVIATIASVQRLVPPERRHAARRLAVLSLLGAPMFTLGYLPATPDPLQGAAVAIAAYLIVRGWFRRAAFLLIAGVLIKHSTALIAIGALILIPQAWIGAALGVILLIPWLLSDTSASFQLERVFTTEMRGPIAIPLTIGSMLGTLGPLTAIGVLAAPVLRVEPKPLAFGASLLVLACFVAVWFGTGEANWPMPAMVFVLPALVGFVVCRGGRLLRIATAIASVSTVLMMIALAHVIVPFLPIPPAKDRTLRSAGFDAVAKEARALAVEVGAKTLVARRYQIASELRYHLQDELTVHELGTSRRSQYDRWPRPPLRRGEVVVLVLPNQVVPIPADLIGPQRPVVRERGGRVLDTYWVMPVRMREDVGR